MNLVLSPQGFLVFSDKLSHTLHTLVIHLHHKAAQNFVKFVPTSNSYQISNNESVIICRNNVGQTSITLPPLGSGVGRSIIGLETPHPVSLLSIREIA